MPSSGVHWKTVPLVRGCTNTEEAVLERGRLGGIELGEFAFVGGGAEDEGLAAGGFLEDGMHCAL